MNKERLEELRERVFVDYQEWDVKCSQDGFQEASPTGEMDADGKDLTTLIDAELTRQSVTGEAVRVAIDWLEAEKASAQNDWERAGAEWRMEPGAKAQHDERMASFDLAIQALRQCQKPCEWIPISERLPTYRESSPGNQIVAWAIHNDPYPRGKAYMTQYSGGWYYFGTNRKITGVTHWKIERGPESEINNGRFLELCKQYGFAVQQDSQSPGIFLRQKDGTLREVTCFPPENEGCK